MSRRETVVLRVTAAIALGVIMFALVVFPVFFCLFIPTGPVRLETALTMFALWPAIALFAFVLALPCSVAALILAVVFPASIERRPVIWASAFACAAWPITLMIFAYDRIILEGFLATFGSEESLLGALASGTIAVVFILLSRRAAGRRDKAQHPR